jgi:glycosyltransferase involved in cell wall biosynthesis
MNTNIEITIIITVYKKPLMLVKRAIDSVIYQTFKDNKEIIIVDDGNVPEQSSLLFNLLLGYNNKNILYVYHANMGQAASINQAVSISKGKYITFLDADDEYKPAHLSTCYKAMDKYDMITSVTETVVTSSDDYLVPDKDDPSIMVHLDNCVCLGTFFAKRFVLEKNKFDNIAYAVDAIFHDRIIKTMPQVRIGRLNSRTYVYHRELGGGIVDQQKKQQCSNQFILSKTINENIWSKA